MSTSARIHGCCYAIRDVSQSVFRVLRAKHIVFDISLFAHTINKGYAKMNHVSLIYLRSNKSISLGKFIE